MRFALEIIKRNDRVRSIDPFANKITQELLNAIFVGLQVIDSFEVRSEC